MAGIKRFDRLEVATTDLAAAAATYGANFGFEVNGARVKIGGAEILLRSDGDAARHLETNGEGMMALWLEADDVTSVAASLRQAGVDPGAVKVESGRRVLAIDPKFASQVPLFIFDRRG